MVVKEKEFRLSPSFTQDLASAAGTWEQDEKADTLSSTLEETLPLGVVGEGSVFFAAVVLSELFSLREAGGSDIVSNTKLIFLTSFS